MAEAGYDLDLDLTTVISGHKSKGARKRERKALRKKLRALELVDNYNQDKEMVAMYKQDLDVKFPGFCFRDSDVVTELIGQNSTLDEVNQLMLVHPSSTRLVEMEPESELKTRIINKSSSLLLESTLPRAILKARPDRILMEWVWDSLESIEASYYVLNFARFSENFDDVFCTQQSRDEFNGKVRSSFAYQWINTHTDFALEYLWNEFIGEGGVEFVQLCQRIRVVMGDLVAPDLSGQGQSVSRFAQKYLCSDSEATLVTAGMTVVEYVKKLCCHHWSQVRKMISFVSESTKQWLDKAFKSFIGYVCTSLFGPVGHLVVNLFDDASRVLIASCAMFSFWILIRLTNVVTDAVAHAIFNFAVTGSKRMFGLVPQAAPDALSLLATLCVAIIGLSSKDSEKVKKLGATMVSMMAGGTVLASACRTLLVILPSTLKMALIMKFGTASQRLEHEIDQWLSMSMSLCAISKIQAVYGSKEYSARVQEQVALGKQLIIKCSNDVKVALRQTLNLTFVRLNTIYTGLLTRKNSTGEKDIPFAIHISGPPGIGKTTSIRDLMVQACGFTEEDLYWRDASDEYWSGLGSHPALVMDEFLLGQPDDNYKVVQSYLTMVSSAEWRPNFASVDDVSVGCKGNVARPKIVVTMNNTKYDMIDAKINNAFQRRRRFVVDVKRSSHYIGEEHNPSNVDRSKYTDQEQKDRKWCLFDICPPVWERNIKYIAKDLTYPELVAFVSEQFESHVSHCKAHRDNMNIHKSEEKTADEILDEVLRDTFAIPSEPPSILEALSSMMPSVLSGQGPISFLCDSFGVPTPRAREDISVWHARYAERIQEELQTTGSLRTHLYVGQSPEIPQSLWERIKSVSPKVWSAAVMLVVVLATAAAFLKTGKDTSEVITFCAQSPKTQKHSARSIRKMKLRLRKVPDDQKLYSQGINVPTVVLGHAGAFVHGVAVGDKWFLTYAHGVDIDSNLPWSVDVMGRVHICNPLDVVVYECPEDDVLMLYLGDKTVPRYKNIAKHFISENDIELIDNSRINIETDERSYYDSVMVRKNTRYAVRNGTEMVQLETAVHYQCPTKMGDCGFPIKIVSGNLMNKILGIHVAGTGPDAPRIQGVATIVTREMVEYAMSQTPLLAQGPNSVNMSCDGLPHCEECKTEQKLEQPNLVYNKKIRSNEQVCMGINTKYKRSAIEPFFDYPTQKEPAILSKDDPRANGVDPLDVSLKELFETKTPTMDQASLDRIEEEMYQKYAKGLNWKCGKRQLTFEEACRGVPKWLNSITTQTSPGYPLCHLAKKKGKTDFVWFDECGELQYTHQFRLWVEERIVEMDNYKEGDEIKSRMLCYFKDDLLKKSKIEGVKTRVTFCNDMISLVAFRMKYGALLSAMMNSFDVTGFAIGLNQYSADMDLIYQFLLRVSSELTAGDFGSYDKNFILMVQEAMYRVFCRLAKNFLGVSDNANAYFTEHELRSPFQVRDRLIKVVCSNKSGCLLTTIINCMVNVCYQMYCHYQKYPTLPFEGNVAAVVLGDDHLIARSKAAEMVPTEFCERLTAIGQVYTSAFKDVPLKDTYDSFEDVTFLGAIPRKSRTGKWTGALRKETLLETPQWTRDGDCSLDMTVQQMIDHASQWDQEFFEEYVGKLKDAYFKAGRVWMMNENYGSLHYCVLNRTAASGADFNVFFGQGPCQSKPAVVEYTCQCYVCRYYDESRNCRAFLHGQGPIVRAPATGFTQVVTAEEQQPSEETGNLHAAFADLCVSAEKVSMPYQTETLVRRIGFDWSSTSTQGAIIQSWNFPFDILNLFNLTNAQNVGFMSYLYSQPEGELVFQLNGTPVQQGALCVFMVPLPGTGDSVPSLLNWTCYDHIILTPNNNSSRSLTVPFRFFRQWLNNKKGFTHTNQEATALIYVGVLSQLTTNTLPSTVSISMYSKFITNFSVPRPRTLTGQGPLLDLNFSSNSVQASTIEGDVPFQSVSRSTSSQSASMLPMDNPPVSGGSAPIYQQFASMSKSVGPQPLNSLQLHQGMMHRQPHALTFGEVTLVSDLTKRRGLFYENLSLSTSDTAGQEKLNFPLNSILDIPTLGAGLANEVPANIAVLNLFQRWRGNLILDFFCVKTVFHSVRLEIVAGYGYTGALTSLDWTGFPSEVIEFTGDNQWASVSIPYTAATEFLNTYNGATGAIYDDSYSMGSLSVFVANPLKVSGAVAQSTVSLMIFARFEDVEVYEPRTNNFVSIDSSDLYQIFGQGPMENLSGSNGENIPSTATVDDVAIEGDGDHPNDVPLINKRLVDRVAPCELKLGAKFEYLVKDVMEIGRRHHIINMNSQPGFSQTIYKYANNLNSGYNVTGTSTMFSFGVAPAHKLKNFFRAWSGHLNYRIFIYTNSSTSNNMAGPARVTYVPSASVAPTQFTNTSTGFPAVTTPNSNIFDTLAAMPPVSTIGQTGAGTTALWAANTYVARNISTCASPAIEFFHPVAPHVWMAEISVPFNTILNYLPCFITPNTPNTYIEQVNGRLIIDTPNFSNDNMAVYQAFGDDFKFHFFGPTNTFIADGVETFSGPFTLPPAGSQLGQNVF